MRKEDHGTLRLLVAGMRWPPETFLGRLLRGLTEEAFDVCIALPSGAGRRTSWDATATLIRNAPTGRPIARTFHVARAGTSALFRSPRSVLQFLRHGSGHDLRIAGRVLPLLGRKFDVVYFPWTSGPLSYRPLLDSDVPTIVSFRGSQIYVEPHVPSRERFVAAMRESIQRVSAGHCVSKAIQTEATALGLAPSSSTVIYTGVDADDFRPLSRVPETSRVRVVMVGSLIWRKGYETALVAVRKALDLGAQIELEIIGEGPDRQRILYTIDDLGLRNLVALEGALSPGEVRDHLRHADIFLLSSHAEGIANSAIEAMSCGVPVISTDCGGMREAIDDGIEGLIVPLRDPNAIARGLAHLAARPELRAEMGRSGRNRVLRQFTLQRHVREFADLCRSVVAETTRR